jgi:alpha-L-rhamnosidase
MTAPPPGAPLPEPHGMMPPRPATVLTPYALRCEHRTTPLGIDEAAPVLAWRLASPRRGDAPVAQRVIVAQEGSADVAGWDGDGAVGAATPVPVGDAAGALAWDSGRIETDAVSIAYGGAPLAPQTRYRWRVTVWGADGSEESAESWFETGLGAPDAWQAAWIARDWDAVEVVDAPEEGLEAIPDHGLQPTPLLRRAFATAGGVAPVRARLYVSARGLYELHVNGARVGDGELTPGWTDYRIRVQYHAYDVSTLLRGGDNVLAATLADGWWSGFVGFDERRPGAHYGSFPQLIAQLRLDYADGSSELIATDERWRTRSGPTRYADLLMGECLDARELQPGWDRPGFDDAGWDAARIADRDTTTLVAAVDEPVRAHELLAPRAIERIGPDRHLVDLGQNIAGRVRLTVRGLPRGRRVTLRHGEALDDDGALYTVNLRSAEATDVLIAAGAPREQFEPRFTFHGFRYVEISGVEQLEPDDVAGVVLHSDTPWAGEFACSDPELERLHRCIGWGQRGNFLSVPTDCPQRDERLGWLADAQVFLPTACGNADVAAFFAKWLQDVRDAQSPQGGFTNVAPRLAGVADEGAPGWADAGVLVPWHLYRTYGDARVLERSIDTMVAWVDFVHRNNPDLVWRNRVGPHFADWVAPTTGSASGARLPPTPRELLATAYFAHSAELTARAAAVLGRERDAQRLGALAARIRTTFAERFVDEDGRVQDDTQTGYLLALAFELLPDELAARAAQRLAEHVERHGHLTTGFLGVGLLAPVLDAIGRDDLAHRLLRREERPSWRYSLRHGATTIWERWDGWSEENGFQAPRMNSFNHYALGSVGQWLQSGLAGLDQTPASVGFDELLIRPRPGALTSARAAYASPRGRAAVAWERDAQGFTLDVEVPPGATAVVHVPRAEGAAPVREGGLELEGRDDVELLGEAQDALVCRIGSGRYRFGTTAVPQEEIAVTTRRMR